MTGCIYQAYIWLFFVCFNLYIYWYSDLDQLLFVFAAPNMLATECPLVGKTGNTHIWRVFLTSLLYFNFHLLTVEYTDTDVSTNC